MAMPAEKRTEKNVNCPAILGCTPDDKTTNDRPRRRIQVSIRRKEAAAAEEQEVAVHPRPSTMTSTVKRPVKALRATNASLGQPQRPRGKKTKLCLPLSGLSTRIPLDCLFLASFGGVVVRELTDSA